MVSSAFADNISLITLHSEVGQKFSALFLCLKSSVRADDDHFDMGTTSPTVPTCPERTLSPPPQEELPSSSPSHIKGDPRASDTTVAQRETVGANCSSKRSAPEGATSCRPCHAKPQ
jgi:hypothetical protein